MKFSKARGIVAAVVFFSVVVGLVVHTGTGTPSALGWRDIAAICPVGALEVLAGAKGFLVHPIVLLIVVLLLGSVLGKAFCSWGCPVPHVRHFFTPKKIRNAEREARVAGAGDGSGEVEGADDASGKGPEAESVAEAGNSAPEAAADAASAAQAGQTAQAAASAAAHTCSSCGACAAKLAPVGGKRDGRRIDSRHVTLIGAIASSFVFGFPVFCLICPVGLSFAVTIGIWNLFRFNEASWGLIVFPLLIIVEVVFFRKWCTKFCPISAVFSLASSHGKLLRPRVDDSKCLRGQGVACTACVKACPEQVDPHSDLIPECSRCGACVDACPAKAISIPLIYKKDAGATALVNAADANTDETKGDSK